MNYFEVLQSITEGQRANVGRPAQSSLGGMVLRWLPLAQTYVPCPGTSSP